ncbi:MAG: cyclic nucleotide-binding domain-containing protein [Mariprofundaceae bacterium]
MSGGTESGAMRAEYNEIFRKAREAAARGDFETARRLYAELWKSPVWRRDRDVQLHYAWSCERTGDYTAALEAYRALMEHASADEVPGEEDALIEESMVRLREMVEDSERDGAARVVDAVRDESEAVLVRDLFAHGWEREFHVGETICRAGDPAAHMWLLVEGEVDVLVPGQSVSTMRGSREKPCLLGELGYFTGMRRAATLCCATEVVVIELSYEKIEALLAQDAELRPIMEHLFRHRLVLPLLSRHEIFKRINDVDRRRLVVLFENSTLRPGQVLIEQGEETPDAWMVQSGTMLLLRREDGEEVFLGSMHPGDMFHLGGLLRGYQAPYRAVAGTSVKLLRLPRAAFEPFMQRRPWLIKAILKHSRLSLERQIMHPEARNLWAANRYIELKPVGRKH